jgi:hypothetical protein
LFVYLARRVNLFSCCCIVGDWSKTAAETYKHYNPEGNKRETLARELIASDNEFSTRSQCEIYVVHRQFALSALRRLETTDRRQANDWNRRFPAIRCRRDE